MKTSARRSTSPVLETANITRLPSRVSRLTSSVMAATEPWKRVVGWVCSDEMFGLIAAFDAELLDGDRRRLLQSARATASGVR